MTTHYGNIERDTAARRVWRYLKAARAWRSTLQITLDCGVCAAHTVIHEIEAQLPPGESIGRKRKGHRWYYRRERVGRVA